MKFTPFPKIETRRLELNQLSMEDAEEIYFLRSNNEVIKYVDHSEAKSIRNAKEFISKINNGISKNEWIMWAIRIKGFPKLIGTICLWNFTKDKTAADIGFVLHPDHQKRGIMTEASNEIIKYGFSELKLDEIAGEVVTENMPSINLMKKFGFQMKNQADNISIYTLTREEYV